MKNIISHSKLTSFLLLFRRPLFLLLRAKSIPDDPLNGINLDLKKPICYIIRSSSIWDIMVLDQICAKHHLPRPMQLTGDKNQTGNASYVYLDKLGIFQISRQKTKDIHNPFFSLAKIASQDKTYDIQFVPVSILWGRNPGKEQSIFKLLFFDEENAGMLQKFFIVLAHGRNIFTALGNPISLRDLLDKEHTPEETARQLRRLLRENFHQQRTAIIGPNFYDRDEMIRTVLNSELIKDVITREAGKPGNHRVKVEEKAKKYAEEIAAAASYPVIRFFDIVLNYLWQKLFDDIEISHLDRLRKIALDGELIYFSCHRSHLDYLLLGHILYRNGLMVPHIASGINLNFWPIGPILRRAGAFFIRRSFKGDKLYAAIFNEYLHLLLSRGNSISFYPEGGRSRTGRLLSPKTGLLSMAVQSFFRNLSKPMIFVPVFLTYDRILEGRSYLKELYGQSKEKESIKQLVGARKALKGSYGKVFINFGTPINLNSFMEDYRKALPFENNLDKFADKHGPEFVAKLAQDLMQNINSAAIINPVSLVSTILLSLPQKAMAEDDLTVLIETMLQLLEENKYHEDTVLIKGSAKEILKMAEKISFIKRFEHPGGDVIYLDERRSIFLNYNRNNILHVFIWFSLVARSFQYNDEMDREKILKSAEKIYPFLKTEFTMRWKPEELSQVIPSIIASMVKLNLLESDPQSGKLKRPSLTQDKFSQLMLLGQILGKTFERYSIVTMLLAMGKNNQEIAKNSLHEQCLLTTRRFSLLNGISDAEYLDPSISDTFLEQLINLGYLKQFDQGKVVILEKIRELEQYTKHFLSPDIRRSIQRIANPN